MSKLTTWTPPVAVSLLLHATLLVLVAYQMSAPRPDISQLQTITVELLGQTPTSVSKPQVQATKPVVPIQPVEEPVPAVNPVPPDLQADAAIPEQSGSSGEKSNAATESQPAAVYPLSKLTRPPAFLRKIEPVYPVAERRAGSQANVLAEVTIDDKGNVLGVRIVKSAGKNFDEAVMEALKKSMFVPGYIDREAVAVRVLVPFRFNLN
jgi:periplasmic protein TonB